MATTNIYNVCLVGAMDRLWFHQIILLSQPNISLLTPQNLEQELSFKSQSLSLSTSSLEDQDIETDSSPASDETNSPPTTPKKEIRPKRQFDGFDNSRYRSQSSLSSRDRRPTRSSSTARLEKSMSCRSLGDLELEEVKGFLDLGFTFKKEHLSPRMMSLIPGLQRLDSMGKDKAQKSEHEEEKDEEDERGVITRPYLSEAWLIRKPSSPLLNLKFPRVSQASDMKKHLRFWARTVASEVLDLGDTLCQR